MFVISPFLKNIIYIKSKSFYLPITIIFNFKIQMKILYIHFKNNSFNFQYGLWQQECSVLCRIILPLSFLNN